MMRIMVIVKTANQQYICGKYGVQYMRITVELDSATMAKVQEFTGTRKKAPAVRRALDGFVRERERKKFLRKVLAGGTDYRMSNEELEALAEYDPD